MTMLDATTAALSADARAFVFLKSGRRLDLLNPDPQAWTDGDLAAGLSRTMRWGGASQWGHPLSVAQHSLTVLAIREGEGPLTAQEGLRELLHDATEFMLGWDCIAPLKAQLGEPFRQLEARLQAAIDARYQLLPWTAEAYAKHKRADRVAAASEAFHVVGWSRTDMVEALGIEIPPLLDDPLPRNGFARWEPWPPRAAQHLFMERFHALAHASRSNMSPSRTPRFGRVASHPATPFQEAIMSHRPDLDDPDLDDDSGIDGDPGADHAAYDEWAAIAGEPAPRAAASLEERTGHAAASFDAIAATLTETQVAAAAHHGSILVLAGAGTGKTSTLTAAVAHRVAVDGIPPHRVLAVTFTNKAASEMANRIRAALGPDSAPYWLGTFHGLAARQLRASPEVASLRENFDILDADDARRILRRVMKALNLSTDEDESGRRDPVKIVAGHIAKFKDRLMTPKAAAAHVANRIAEANRTKTPIDAAGLLAAARAYGEYQARLREANAADFGDLLLWPTLALFHDADYRAQWSGKFDWVHADEYQDVNFAQYTWLKMLALHGKRLFAVGDDDQSIYGWRGADVAYIRQFKRDFPDAVDIRLEENFRSTGHILAAANAIIAEDKARLGKTLFTRKGQGARVELMSFRDGEAEAGGLAEALLTRKRKGARWAEMAVLYRNNFLSRGLEEALMRARIPYRLIGDVGFYARAEIKDALALLRLAAMPDDRQSDEAFRRVINEPRRGFGSKAIEVLERDAAFFGVSLLKGVETAALPSKAREAGLQFVHAVRAVAEQGSLTLADQLSLLLDRTGYREMLRMSRAENMEPKLENLAELVNIAGGFHTARELLDHAALATDRAGQGDGDTVSLMTLHKAKGLEFPHVFLPVFEAGIIPSTYGDLDEERRLAYVALTRGMRQVRISWALYRRGPTEPSPFLDPIPEESRVFLSRVDPRRLSPRARAGLRHVAGRLRQRG